MYEQECLTCYPYFEEQLKTFSLKQLSDPLTGLISRQFIIDFAQDLISRKVPFYLIILDLDNFKAINDNYGHRVGDQILTSVSEKLINFFGSNGIVGRIGGDEFLAVYTKATDYDHIHAVFQDIYDNAEIFRLNYHLATCSPFVTATIGCACYPRNAEDYESLFAKMDKALYRGKIKGRNCFIIYVPEKHDHLEISKLAHQDLITILDELTNRFDYHPTLYTKLKNAYYYLQSTINLMHLYWLKPDNHLFDCSACKDVSVITDTYLQDMVEPHFFDVMIDDMPQYSQELYDFFVPANTSSFLFVRIRKASVNYGYLIYAQDYSNRIWQNDEKAMLLYLGRLLSEVISPSVQLEEDEEQ